MSNESYSKGKINKSAGRWTKEEHQRFVEALKLYGKNWKKVEEFVGTRTGAQVRSHAQKFFNRLQREVIPGQAQISCAPRKFSGCSEASNISGMLSEYFSDEEKEIKDKVTREASPLIVEAIREVPAIQPVNTNITGAPDENEANNTGKEFYYGSFYEAIMEKFKLYRKECFYNLKLSDLVDLAPRSWTTTSQYGSNNAISSFREAGRRNSFHFSCPEEPLPVKRPRLNTDY
eukprot:TRINITY_DN9183_c0_g2_i1.p1 TRINITY_DN9183_c0_g2~~TRINITY_DN9183_c0_g2_i1.p1  ORF type:complete len:232 (-),score=46.79 TRINITY_DN9183_c0_g2_i1:60-755(-)